MPLQMNVRKCSKNSKWSTNNVRFFLLWQPFAPILKANQPIFTVIALYLQANPSICSYFNWISHNNLAFSHHFKGKSKGKPIVSPWNEGNLQLFKRKPSYFGHLEKENKQHFDLFSPLFQGKSTNKQAFSKESKLFCPISSCFQLQNQQQTANFP